ncbi:MAG: hypothetical protein ACOZNI_12135 [Myxococcota bacterium]
MWWLFACQPDADPPKREDEAALLSGTAWAARASIDLVGRRPTLDELARVEAGEPVEDLVDEWLDDPAFAARMAWLWNDAVHTAVYFDDYERFGPLTFTQWKAMGWEPLALVEALVAEDRPLTELVTSPELLADPALAELWDVAYTGDAEEWAWTAYTDGRPMAGILSSNSLWQRWTGDATNYNRRRANTVASVFLCADFFDREGEFTFTVDSADLADVETAVQTQTACLTCHAALDPLASYLGGFPERSQDEPLERFRRYSPEQAAWFAALTAPAYYGHPGGDLADLGARIAADGRFARCAARRFAEGLGVDGDFTGELVAGDMLARPLARAIVTSDEYRAPDERVVTTEQLHGIVADLLGWDDGTEWDEGLKPLTWSVEHRVMGGGTDDDTVLLRNRSPGVGTHVLLEWVARQAVGPALEADLARPLASRRILTLTEGLPATQDDIYAQLAAWHTRFLSAPVEPDSPEVRRLVDLWLAADDPAGEVIEALIRHPAQVIY